MHVPRGWRTGFYWEGGSPAITIILHCYGGGVKLKMHPPNLPESSIHLINLFLSL